MEGFYRHIKCKEKTRKNERRRHMSPQDAPQWLPWRSEFTVNSDPQMLFLDHRILFEEAANVIQLNTEKPLLIVHNKYNIEWETGGPVNFIDASALDYIFSSLKFKYQIVYARHGIQKLPGEYNRDENAIMITDEDINVLKRHPEVWLFEDVWDQYKSILDYNSFKGGLYAKCYKFITSQGGGCHQCSSYSNSEVHVLHVRGDESFYAYKHGVYNSISNPSPRLYIYHNNEHLKKQCVELLG
jgi:hypothetical protein